MGPFKKYVTCIMTFVTPFNYLSYFLSYNFTLTIPLCYSLNFTKKLQHERKEYFFVYGYFSEEGISKELKNHNLRHNWIFRHTCCINNTNWQSSRIIIFFCKYYIFISDILVGSFLDMLFLMLAVILSGFHDKSRRNKDCVTE